MLGNKVNQNPTLLCLEAKGSQVENMSSLTTKITVKKLKLHT